MFGGRAPGGGDAAEAPGGSGDAAEARAERMVQFFRRFDTDNTGTIDLSQLDERAQGMARRLAERAGIDPDEPIRINRLRERLVQAEEERRRGQEGDEEGERRRRPDEAEADDEPLVPGFGWNRDLSIPPGFSSDGEPGEEAARDSPPRRGGRGGSGDEAASSEQDQASEEQPQRGGGDRRGPERPGPGQPPPQVVATSAEDDVRDLARQLMAQYDRNEDGVLQPDEWRRMRGNPEAMVRRSDQTITEECLVVYLRQYSGNGGGGGGARAAGPGGTTAASIRVLTPTERLPDGLPEWFTRLDRNGDGQVSMAEFLDGPPYSAERAAEFARYDLNGDGFITPEEYLRARNLRAGR